ncbi:hypothetical protein CY34DRAFT_803096 [Suillus luteus UH-Slu-Lm8-n1]|uniref:Uncharacterized protein n=1 Tax=Suillus luteus UH-Slu-Lm8-n1 TaxID=930992 RepID=A0A0D0BLC5_9AGAM|nr:hypothetical protein CY34DRAFT_803096 [Suillus luteus UH-Slu-Lm8-n1]
MDLGKLRGGDEVAREEREIWSKKADLHRGNLIRRRTTWCPDPTCSESETTQP